MLLKEETLPSNVAEPLLDATPFVAGLIAPAGELMSVLRDAVGGFAPKRAGSSLIEVLSATAP